MSSFSVLRGCPSRWYDLGTTLSASLQLCERKRFIGRRFELNVKTVAAEFGKVRACMRVPRVRACVRVCTCVVCVYVHVHSKRQNEMTWCETDQCRNANDHKMFHKVPQ